MKKLPVAVMAALIAVMWTLTVLAAPAYQQTESVDESAQHTIITVSGSDISDVGHNIVTVKSDDKTDSSGHNIVTVQSDDKAEGEHVIINVESDKKDTTGKKTNHQIITVSGGDTISVVGEPKDARAGYEDYGGYYTLWDADDDGYDDYYNYVNDNIYDYSEGYGDYGDYSASFAPVVSYADGSQSVGYYDYGYGYDDSGYYDDGYYGGGISRGFNGTVILVALGIGLIVALTYYASTKHAYENAGIGVVYDLRDNAILKLAGDGVIDRQIDQRSSVDRGFYGRSSGSVYASPQAGNLSAGRPGNVQVHIGGPVRPSAPNMPPRPGQNQRPKR